MTCRRRMIPLLTVVLVIQSLVGALPHTHGLAADGQRWQGSSALGETHHCLACSVHAPVVEPAAGFGDGAGAAIVSPASVEPGSTVVFPVRSTASPRGPPRIV